MPQPGGEGPVYSRKGWPGKYRRALARVGMPGGLDHTIPPSEHHTCPEVYEQASDARVTYSGRSLPVVPGAPSACLCQTVSPSRPAGRRWIAAPSSKGQALRRSRECLVSPLFSQRFSEDRETGFGLRIIEQDRAGFIRLHRGGIDNRASGLEVRQCGAGDPERRVDVGFKGSVESSVVSSSRVSQYC
ncbi:Uncharacterised protein [Klebsiella aerogenes]|nr:Uncharacterised protein [Klebsiella aerogenes]